MSVAELEEWGFSTVAIHADRSVEPCHDVAPPLHMATTFGRSENGYVYSREDQPTRRRLELVLGRLEGGVAVTYPSGQAAATAVLRHCRPRRVAIDRGYFGTHDLLMLLEVDGIERIRLDEELAEGDLVWLETPKNPGCELEDIEHHVARAHAAGAAVCVDSTLATPVLQTPLALGADLVMHSSTKFLGGHSDALGGVIVARDEPTAEQLRRDREVFGAVPGALESWLTLRSVRTLSLRVEHQTKSAETIARRLSNRVPRVSYPALPSHPEHEVYRRQMRGGGGVLAFETESASSAQRLADGLKLFRRAVSLGGVESLVDWRHEWDPGCPPALLRLSVGLESTENLIADLDRGLAESQT